MVAWTITRKMFYGYAQLCWPRCNVAGIHDGTFCDWNNAWCNEWEWIGYLYERDCILGVNRALPR
jgi:hypothetical protein